MPMLVGVGYRKRAGKDTVADYLVENHGFKKTAWADLLKAGVNVWHGWDDRYGYGDLKEAVDPYFGYSPRTAYQKIGTDLMRDRWSSTFWVDCAMRQIKEWMKEGHSVVVSDSRFPDEVNAILGTEGGQVWLVNRPSLPNPNPAPRNRLVANLVRRWKRTFDDPNFEWDHLSEVGLLDFESWNQTLVNDGTLEGLYEKVEKIMAESNKT